MAPRALIFAVSTVLVVTSSSVAGVALAVDTSSCSYDSGTAVATVDVAGGSTLTIARSGDALAIDGTACGAASVANTDRIDVVVPDVDLAETVVIDLSGGPLAPGATDEGDGSSEIEIDVDFATGILDTLRIVGSSSADNVSAGYFSINLNADEAVPDPDVTSSTDSIALELLGGDGDDDLVLEPLNALGATTSVMGEGGDDRLIGDGEGSVLVGGSGRDTSDYSWANDNLSLEWDPGGNALVWRSGFSQQLEGVEVVILTDSHDTIVYNGEDALGETRAGGGADAFHVFSDSWSGLQGDHVIRAGVGSLDTIEFHSTSTKPVRLEIGPNAIQGSWSGTFFGVEYVLGGDGDDRFELTERGTLTGVVGAGGDDVVDLRAVDHGLGVTLGQQIFGQRKWLRAFEVERVLGTDFNDVLLGPSGLLASQPVELVGFLGRDELRGGDGSDALVGGAGSDRLVGGGGGDSLRAWIGNDVLEGGTGPDGLRGGPGNDFLDGGIGPDSCDGGGGSNTLISC